MSQASDFPSVLAAALSLPSEERESLVGRLNASLDDELRDAVGDARLAEVQELRIRRFRAGESKGWTIEEVAAEVERRRNAWTRRFLDRGAEDLIAADFY